MSTTTITQIDSRSSAKAKEPYSREHTVASLAVQRAVLVSKKVLNSVDCGELAKGDDTPVSLADFASQALIVSALHNAFPHDIIVGEEDASALRKDEQLANSVWDLVRSTHLDNATIEEALARPQSKEEMMDLIDLAGSSEPNAEARVWTIDPIDGTLTYLQGKQYSVVASLMEKGQQVVSTIACPHIRLSPRGDGGARPIISEAEPDVDKSEGAGFIVSAIKGQGVFTRPLRTGGLAEAERVEKRKRVQVVQDLVFAESTQTYTPQFEDRHLIAEELGVPWPVTGPLRIYSTQLRYVALALGSCDVVLRLPQKLSQQPWIWDHAGGMLMYEELGGKVTDLRGQDMVMTSGRKLTRNYGILAAPAEWHEKVLGASQKVLKRYDKFRDYVEKGVDADLA